MVCDGPLAPHYVLHWTRSALEEIKSRASGDRHLRKSRVSDRRTRRQEHCVLRHHTGTDAVCTRVSDAAFCLNQHWVLQTGEIFRRGPKVRASLPVLGHFRARRTSAFDRDDVADGASRPPLRHRAKGGVGQVGWDGGEGGGRHTGESGGAGGLGLDRLEVDEPRLERRPRQPLQGPTRAPVLLDLVVQRAECGGDRLLFRGWR